MIQVLPQDFRYAFRQLLKNPQFTLVALLSLGLGIGATTAVFSVVYAILMNPYPYKDSERLVHMRLIDNAGRERGFGLNGPQIQRLRQAHCVESATGEEDWNLTTTGDELPEDVSGVYLTANSFVHFGVPALVGREFIPSDAPDGDDPQPVVVLGYKFWQRHYGGDRQIIGHNIQLVHKTYTVIGVVPSRFTWGDGDVYLPLKLSSDPKHYYSPEIRLKRGVTYAAANAELQPIIEDFAKLSPDQFPKKFRFQVKGLNEMFVQQLGKTLWMLLGAVGLLLVIGCANVSILLLARGTARGHELAVRAAVGANRLRIISQLLVESLLLALGGAFLGVMIANSTVAMIASWLPEGSFPNEAAIEVNIPVMLFSIGIALLSTVFFGLSPAISLSRPEIAKLIQANTRRVAGSVEGRRANHMLIAVQIALTVVLLTTAGAAVGGFLHLMRVGLGYDPHNVMSVGIPVHDHTYMTWAERSTYFDQLQARVATLPDVVSVGISTNATPPNNGWDTNFEIFGAAANEGQQLSANFVSPEYFPVLKITPISGRIWDHAETLRGAHLAVINETLAHRFWPHGDAVGHQLRLPKMKGNLPYNPGVADSDSWLQVVGVVPDARNDGLRNTVKPAVYVPYTMVMNMYTQLLVRTKGAPLSTLRRVREQVKAVNADQQVMANVRDLDHWITTQPEWAQQRLVAGLFGAFAVLALMLAGVGLYSVVSYTVVQMTNEIGIRMSLGARQEHILKLVFSSTAVSVVIGLAAGVLSSVVLNNILRGWTEGSSRSPLIVAAASVVLIGSAMLACFVPARRASAVDPMIALRYQ